MILQDPATPLPIRPLNPAIGANVAGYHLPRDGSVDASVATMEAAITTALGAVPVAIRDTVDGWVEGSGGISKKPITTVVGGTGDSQDRMRALTRYTRWGYVPGGYGGGITGEGIISLSSDPTIILHEYGHVVDGAWPTRPLNQLLSFRTDFHDIYMASLATIPTELYGRQNPMEWFAECFAVQLMPGYGGGGSTNDPRLFWSLCGRSNLRATALRALFVATLPDMPPYTY